MVDDTKYFGDINKWLEISRNIYRKVCGANVCYELIITHWVDGDDINSARAILFVCGSWVSSKGQYFSREQLAEGTVKHCLVTADVDYLENMK